MPHERLLFKSAAREKVLRGATALADSVRGTLGPRAASETEMKNRREAFEDATGSTST